VGVVAHDRLSPVRIASADDPRLAEWAALRDPVLRRTGLFVAEGRLVVEQVLTSGRRVRSILASDAGCEGLADALARTATAPAVYVADGAVLTRVAGYAFHHGCMALVERGPERSAAAVLADVGPGPGVVVVFDEVTNPDNVGALFRNAEAFGARAVLLSPGSSDPLYRKTVRVSMGSVARVPHARVTPWPDGMQAVRAAGFALVALTPGGGDLEDFEIPRPRRVALVVGSEGPGVSPSTLALVDATIGIPMAPGVDSPNVAAASAVALHRLTRR
jgi:tRNA G18 (ribose-2'-O)-methylase SpoU